jgi:hypothetical protein
MRQYILGLIAISWCMAGCAFGDTIVYSNVTTDTGDALVYSANGYTQIGDQLTLAGTDRLATFATVQFSNDSTTGTFDATLAFFNVGPNSGNPVGSQIGSNIVTTGTAIAQNGIANVNFTVPNILLPDNVIFTVTVSSLTGGVDLGLDMFEAPTVGSSDNTFAIANNGSAYLQASTASENVYFLLQATTAPTVPEPGTLALAGVALLAFAGWRRSTAARS